VHLHFLITLCYSLADLMTYIPRVSAGRCNWREFFTTKSRKGPDSYRDHKGSQRV